MFVGWVAVPFDESCHSPSDHTPTDQTSDLTRTTNWFRTSTKQTTDDTKKVDVKHRPKQTLGDSRRILECINQPEVDRKQRPNHRRRMHTGRYSVSVSQPEVDRALVLLSASDSQSRPSYTPSPVVAQHACAQINESDTQTD